MPGELILPPYLYPSRMELEMVDVIGQFNPAFGYSTSQRIDYGATRWHAKLSFEKLRTSERHELLTFLARAGRLRAFVSPLPAELRGVSSYFTELLNTTNPLFVNSTSGWTSASESLMSLLESGRVLRSTLDSLPNNAKTGVRNNTVTSIVPAGGINFPHVHRTLLLPGRNAAAFNLTIRQGITDNNQEYGTKTASYGYVFNTFVPTSTSLSCQVRDAGSGSLAIGDYFETALISASRCGVITTSGQLGSNLYSGGWPSSISNLLRAGDFVNVHLPNGLHLARLVAPLHTTSGGLGYLQLEPGLPEMVPASSSIVPYMPMLKCVAIAPPSVRTYPPGYISDVEVEVEGVFG